MLNPTINSICIKQQNDLIMQPPTSGVTLRGSLIIPGDKSISHRALMLGALAQGETQIQGLLRGEDVISTANCLRSLGVKISALTAATVLVRGRGLGQLPEPSNLLNAGNIKYG